MNWRDQREHTLIDWSRDLNRFVDDGVEPMTGAAIDRAIKLCGVLRELDSPVFTMMPDVNGGIVIEYKVGDTSHVYNIWEDGSMGAHVYPPGGDCNEKL